MLLSNVANVKTWNADINAFLENRGCILGALFCQAIFIKQGEKKEENIWVILWGEHNIYNMNYMDKEFIICADEEDNNSDDVKDHCKVV